MAFFFCYITLKLSLCQTTAVNCSLIAQRTFQHTISNLNCLVTTPEILTLLTKSQDPVACFATPFFFFKIIWCFMFFKAKISKSLTSWRGNALVSECKKRKYLLKLSFVHNNSWLRKIKPWKRTKVYFITFESIFLLNLYLRHGLPRITNWTQKEIKNLSDKVSITLSKNVGIKTLLGKAEKQDI